MIRVRCRVRACIVWYTAATFDGLAVRIHTDNSPEMTHLSVWLILTVTLTRIGCLRIQSCILPRERPIRDLRPMSDVSVAISTDTDADADVACLSHLAVTGDRDVITADRDISDCDQLL